MLVLSNCVCVYLLWIFYSNRIFICKNSFPIRKEIFSLNSPSIFIDMRKVWAEFFLKNKTRSKDVNWSHHFRTWTRANFKISDFQSIFFRLVFFFILRLFCFCFVLLKTSSPLYFLILLPVLSILYFLQLRSILTTK